MENLVSTLEYKAMEHRKLFIEFKLEAERIKEILVQLNNIKTPSELCAALNKKNEKADQSPPHSWLQKNVESPPSETCAAVNKKNEKDYQPPPCSTVQKNVECPSSEICAAVNTKHEKEEQPPSSSRVNETYVAPYLSQHSYTSFHGIQHHPNAPSFIYGYPYPYASPMPPPVVFGNAYRRSESKNLQYEIDLYKIINDGETRTMLIIKNIPYKFTSKMLLSVLEKKHRGIYDFLYLPFNAKEKRNFGRAFINLLSPKLVIPFYQDLNGKKWDDRYNSDIVATLAYAYFQGKAQVVKPFQNLRLINDDKRCWPILFRSQGVKNIDQEQFPSSNVNIIIRQRDGSYAGDYLKSSKDDSDEKLENE